MTTNQHLALCVTTCVYDDYHPGPCLTEEDLDMDEWFVLLFEEEDQHLKEGYVN